MVFELASVLFNLGVAASLMGSKESVSSVEGVKRACNSFQLAAGIFEYINTHYANQISLLPQGSDINGGVLQALQAIMLAQAQECFVLKATMERTVRNTTLAKLAGATSALYDAARGHVVSCSRFFPAVIASYLGAKSQLYQATAHYRKSMEFLEEKQYGREIYKLREALDSLNGARDLATASGTICTDATILSSSILQLVATLKKELDRATKDNDLIYQEPIPVRGAWSEVGSAVVVKPFAFPEATLVEALSAPFLFEAIPNFKTAAAASEVRANAPSLLEPFNIRLSDALNQIEEIFVRHNLPSSVEAVMVPSGIPDEILVKSQELQQQGGIPVLHGRMEAIQSSRKSVLQTLEQASSFLRNEQSEDDLGRQKFGPKWNRAPSSTLTPALRKRHEDLSQAMIKANETDQSTETFLDAHLPHILSLTSSRQELEATIPKASSRHGHALYADSIWDELRMALPKRDEFRERAKVIMDFIYATYNSIDIVQRTQEIADTQGPSSVVNITQMMMDEIQAALSHHEPEVQSFANEAGEYGRLVERLMAEFNINNHKNEGSSSASGREEALRQLNAAHQAYKTVLSQFDSADLFYADAQKQATALFNACQDFALGRHQEAQSLTE